MMALGFAKATKMARSMAWLRLEWRVVTS
jgi:hypothetical protein